MSKPTMDGLSREPSSTRHASRTESIPVPEFVYREIKRPAGLSLPLAIAVVDAVNQRQAAPPPLPGPPPSRRRSLLPRGGGEWLLAVLVVLGLAGAAAWTLEQGRQDDLFAIEVVAGIACIALVVKRCVGLSLPCLWGLALWGAAHLSGLMASIPGQAGVLYDLWLVPGWLRYDQVVHVYAFCVLAWVCWQALRRRLEGGGYTRPTLGMVLLAAMAAMGLGATKDVIEFAAARLAESAGGGDSINAFDLALSMTGAALAAALIWIRGTLSALWSSPAAAPATVRE